MTPAQLLVFMRRHNLAVQASTSALHEPQAAVVGIVISDRFEVFFDTLDNTRKCVNLRRDPRVALVIGWDLIEGATVQVQGTADEPRGDELAALKRLYFERFPDGREREGWPGITYFRVRPHWVRFSGFSGPAPEIVEFDAEALARVSVR